MLRYKGRHIHVMSFATQTQDSVIVEFSEITLLRVHPIYLKHTLVGSVFMAV